MEDEMELFVFICSLWLGRNVDERYLNHGMFCEEPRMVGVFSGHG